MQYSVSVCVCVCVCAWCICVLQSPYNPNVLPSCMIDSSEPGSMVGDTLVSGLCVTATRWYRAVCHQCR